MRSQSTRRTQSALITGFVAFVFFTLIWRLAGVFSLGESLGVAAFMGLVAAMANLSVTRLRDGRAGR